MKILQVFSLLVVVSIEAFAPRTSIPQYQQPSIQQLKLHVISGSRHIPCNNSARNCSHRRSTVLARASTTNTVDQDDFEESGRLPSRNTRFMGRMKRAAERTGQWMHKVIGWQRSKRRSLLAAAAFAVSLLVMTPVAQHYYATTTAAPVAASRTEIHRVVKIPDNARFRGGGNDNKHNVELTAWQREEIALANMEKAVEEGVVTASRNTGKTLIEASQDLMKYMEGPKADTLLLLLATALITPLCKRVSLSPILGFLASGMLLGPNGWGLISGIHTTETLAELGIVFFLFEMGIELSFERLKSMRRDVFGLGFSQFLVTALAVAGVGKVVGLPANALVVLGGGLALSSSAFVLQLLKDKNQLATRFGKAAFGVLLFQDLAVVPLLVVTPILAGNGSGLAKALTSALVKAAMALTSIAFAGRVVLNPLFKIVAQAQSQEAFLGVVLLTVLSMSFMTEGLGLSNTLGAFLAGVLLSETKYRYQVEADIAPFRGILLGLFFVTVGFEIDLKLIASNLPLVSSLVFGIMAVKALITTALSLAFGLSLSTSQQTGLILSQGGEFAFVAFGLARSLGILDAPTTKLMLTSVSLTMALTPLMATLGSKIAKRLEEQSDFTHYLGQDRDANEIKESDDFTVVVGYGAVGKVVCDLLDRKFLKYVGLEIDPNKAIQARNAGLPIFYGDIGRQEVAEAFNVGRAKTVVVCIADKAQANRVLIALRRWYPDLKIFARAADADHASRLQNTLNVAAMVPILPEDNLLLTLPFGGAVMKALGVPLEEANAIVEGRRKELLNLRGVDREEEELELLQLGIASKSANATDAGVIEVGSTRVFDDEKETSSRTESAKERRKAAEEKSPFVARVIQEVCPGSAEDEPCLTPEQLQLLSDAEDDMETEVGPDVAAAMANRTLALARDVFTVDDE
jgi:monovalent cation:H+ antiporter-2, CPA2 family